MLQPSTTPDLNSTAKTPLFQSSTQYRNWRFSVEQLKSTRASLNQAAVAAIRNTFESDSVCRWAKLTLSRLTSALIDETRNSRHVMSLLARFVFRCSFSRRQRGAPSRQAVYLQNIPIMWSFSLPGGSRGHWNNVLETILPKEHGDGLASQECHVGHLFMQSSVLVITLPLGSPPCILLPKPPTTPSHSNHIRRTYRGQMPRMSWTLNFWSLKVSHSNSLYGTLIVHYGEYGLTSKQVRFSPYS
jgi:hypothetical protein